MRFRLYLLLGSVRPGQVPLHTGRLPLHAKQVPVHAPGYTFGFQLLVYLLMSLLLIEIESGPVTHRDIVTVRDFIHLKIAPLMVQDHESDPPYTRLAWNYMVSLFDRLIVNRATVSASEIKTLILATHEGVKYREANGYDRFAEVRPRVLDLLYRLADEQPDATAGMPCPIPPLGIRIRDRRKAAHLTQEQLGRRIGVNEMTVSRWENDQGREPAIQFRRLLAKVLGGKTSDYTRD